MHRWEVTALKAQRWRREGVKYGGGEWGEQYGRECFLSALDVFRIPRSRALSALRLSPADLQLSSHAGPPFNAGSLDSISTANKARSGSVRRHRAGLKVTSALGWSCFTACLLPRGGTIPGVTPSVSLMFHFAELFLVWIYNTYNDGRS